MRWTYVIFLAALAVVWAQTNNIDHDILETEPKDLEPIVQPSTIAPEYHQDAALNDDVTSNESQSDEDESNNGQSSRSDEEANAPSDEEVNAPSDEEANAPSDEHVNAPSDEDASNENVSSDTTNEEVNSNENGPGSNTEENSESNQDTDTGEDSQTESSTPVTPVNSSENGGEESAETDRSSSNEVIGSRSMEITSREAVGEAVETEGGLVQGYSLHGASGIRSYIDIPYGKFTALFQAPTKPAQWDTVHTIDTHQKQCPQLDANGDYTGDTDCLTLSVFTPTNVENAAVLFHIYDGDFTTGSADPNIYGPEYLVTKGIILVLPNYRLGALGFLCMRNNIAPGNAGLKDLTLALEWTKNNIAKFGGDPSKITVSGDGRSGALAGYLAMSPVSRPYIGGVIVESGSMLAHWSIDREPNATASLLMDAIKADITNEINAETVVKSAKNIIFKPCVETGEHTFLNETPWKILDNETNKIEIPFMIGSANHAGVQEAMEHTAESISQLNNNFVNFLPNDLKFENGEEANVAEEIKTQYFGNRTIGLEHIIDISLCYTDAYYLGPAIRVSRALVASGAKVYFFEFSFVGELNRMLGSLSTTVQGAARGDLVSYTFTQDGEMPLEGSDEERLVDTITDLWITFIQTGKPSADGVEWNELQKVSAEEEEYLVIDRAVSQQKGLHIGRLALWTDIYNKYFIERNLAVNIQSKLFLIVTAIVFFCLYKDL